MPTARALHGRRPRRRHGLLATGAVAALTMLAAVVVGNGVAVGGGNSPGNSYGNDGAPAPMGDAPAARALAPAGGTVAAMATDTTSVVPTSGALAPQLLAAAAQAITDADTDGALEGTAGADDGGTPAGLTLGATGSTAVPFVSIGISWAGPATATAAVRVRTGAGTPSAWHALEPEAAPGGDAPGAEDAAAPTGPVRTVSAPVWVGGADTWELALDGAMTDVRVHVVRTSSEQVTVDPGAVAAPAVATRGAGDATFDRQAVAIARPAIRGRAAWGARTPSAESWTASSLRLVVLHHTGSGESPSYAQTDVPAMLRAVQAYHIDANGWNDIGYNFVVDRFGTIWEGRGGGVDQLVVGAHAFGVNTGSVGIAVLGDLTSIAPSAATLDAVAALAAWKLFRHGADPRVPATFLPRATDKFTAMTPTTLDRVVGHRDVGFTGCPGNLYGSLPALRTDITARYLAMVGDGSFADRTIDRPATGFPVLGDFTGDAITDIFWYRAGTTPDELWAFRTDGTFSTATYDLSGDAAGAFATRVLDWDGDGADDIVFYAPTASQARMLAGRRSGTLQVELLPASGDYVPYAGDFNGDGDDDMVWYSPGRRDAWVWAYDNGTTRSRSLGTIGGPFRVVTGDFDGDTRGDLLWYGPEAAPDQLWYGAGDLNLRQLPAQVGGSFWPFAADLNGDQRDDIVWTTFSGPMPLWWGGTTFTGSVSDFGPQQAYRTVDVNGGGIADVVTVGYDGLATAWIGSRSGVVNAGRSDPVPVTLPLTGDFNGDGRTDVIWWRSGQLSPMWLAT